MVNIDISLEGANGDIINLTDSDIFILSNGALGFGMPPVEVRIDDSASDGGIHRFTRRGIRELDLPIVIINSERSVVETELRRLSNLLSDRQGPTTIRATYSTGEIWELTGHYVGGADAIWGDEQNMFFARWVIQFQCPNPYWVRQQSESISIGTPGAGRGLIGTGRSLVELQVGSSQAIGEIVLENSGDVDAYPVWQFDGPMDYVTLTNFDETKSFSYEEPILEGESVIVDTFAGTVVSETGVNRYANLGAAPKFFTIPPGVSDVTIEAVGTDTNTLISLFFQPRKEIVH
jgi:hypothetical protein